MWNEVSRLSAADRKEVCMQSVQTLWLSFLLFAFLAVPVLAQQKPVDLAEISVQNLMNIQITSASKEDQKMSQVAAAVFVISQADIQQSGSTNIPDLLRMVLGLDVAQINANSWAIFRARL